jgi:hypothetical protein
MSFAKARAVKTSRAFVISDRRCPRRPPLAAFAHQEKTMTKLIVKPSKPRNPLVAAAHFRRAGRHGDANHARRDGHRALRSEISGLELPRDVRSKPPSL